MPRHFDAIVIGTGGVGSATLYHLARRGKSVLGLDRHLPGHGLGSSHGETRVIRQAYAEHPDYVPLVLRAYELWRELEAVAQRQNPLLVETGLLQVGAPDGSVLQGVYESARQHNLSVESLTAGDIAERFPQFVVNENQAGAYETAAGYLLVEECVRTHIAAAESAGASWVQEAATSWSAIGSAHDGFEVKTSSTAFTCDRLVITAGPWVGELLPKIAAKTKVVRKHQHWFRAPDSASKYSVGEFPIYLIQTEDAVFYGLPSIDGESIKVAEHTRGTVVTTSPSEASVDPEPEDTARVKTFLSQYLPAVTGDPIRHAPCFYTMTEDEHFIVGEYPDQRGLFLAAGLSGHGFKFTSVLGSGLADMVIDGTTDLPIGFLAPSPTT